jgi:hypothetical protein
MSILSLNDWIASYKENFQHRRNSRTSVALQLTTIFDQTGYPGQATLAGTNTANGVVPTDATAGAAPITSFAGGATGYLSKVQFFNSVTGTLFLYDLLFKAGAYAYNANVALASQPSFQSRCPDYSGGASWGKGNQIILEQVTASTGNLSVAVTYTNQDGVAGRSTGTVATGAAFIVGRCLPLPLQAGDSGVQKIESVVGSVASAGTFNILVVRLLAKERIRVAGDVQTWDMVKTGLVKVFDDSCIVPYFRPDSTASGICEVEFDIASK